MTPRTLPLLVACLIMALPACSGGNGTGPDGVASVAVSPSSLNLSVGQAQQLTAEPRDNAGNPLDRTVTWTTQNSLVAQVDVNGNVTAVAPGSASITATADGVAGTIPVDVNATAPVVITQVSPATLVPGQAATITGTGFGTSPALHTVTIDGVTASVTQATATTLQFIVPSDCSPKRIASIQARFGTEASNTLGHPLEPAIFVDLNVGESAVINFGDRCLQFDATAAAERYVFGVQSTSQSPSSNTLVNVRGSIPAGAAPPPQLAPPVLDRAAALQPVPTVDMDRVERWQRHRAAKLEFYERNRPMWQRMLDASREEAVAFSAVPSVPNGLQVGDIVDINFPQLSGNSCLLATTIRARVRRISTQAIILQDSADVFQLDASFFSDAANSFAQAHSFDVSHFGDPGDADNNSRVAIVLTTELNRRAPNVLGFVNHADRLPQGQNNCPASNEGELIFTRSVNLSGPGTQYSLSSLTADLPSLLIHEFTHIIQSTRRVESGGQFMASFVAEGLATGAEELGGLQILGLGEGMNHDRTAIYTGNSLSPYFEHMRDLMNYFGWAGPGGNSSIHIPGTPAGCTWIDGASQFEGNCVNQNRLIYGPTWSFIKHTIDSQGGGPANQQARLRAFSDWAGSIGFAEIEAALGIDDIETALAQWAPMLYIDDRYPGIADYQNRNFNLRDIAASFHPTAADLRAQMVGFQNFDEDLVLRAGSSAYFDMSGANRPPTAIRFRDAVGNALPGSVQIWVVRVQ